MDVKSDSGPSSDAPLTKQRLEDAQRYKRLLKEQVYLLKHTVGTSIGDFLQQKLSQTLDRQLKMLVDGPLKEAFQEVRKFLDEKEKKIADGIFSMKGLYKQRITTNVKQFHLEMARNQKLIDAGQKLLDQNDVTALESVQAHKLLRDLQLAVRKDNATGEELLNVFLTLNRWKVHRVGGVLRAVDRLRLDPPSTDEKAKEEYFESADKPAMLETARITYEPAFQISMGRVAEKWPQFDQQGNLDKGEPMQALVKELAYDLATNFSRLHEYAQSLFSKYNELDLEIPEQADMEPISDDQLTKLTYEAMDSIQLEFEEIQLAKNPSTYERLRNRMDSLKRVNKATFSVAWASWVEKAIERALIKLVHEQQKPTGGTIFSQDDASGAHVYVIED